MSNYLIDANSFITPYRNYYRFYFTKNYWATIEKLLIEKRVVLLKVVYEEITKNQDALSLWIKKIPSLKPMSVYDNLGIMKNYSQVLNYVKECGLYKDIAYIQWSDEKVADPFLIAAAQYLNYPIVTFEQSAGTLSKKQPSKNPKIPDVAKHFSVECITLFDFMQQMNITL